MIESQKTRATQVTHTRLSLYVVHVDVYNAITWSIWTRAYASQIHPLHTTIVEVTCDLFLRVKPECTLGQRSERATLALRLVGFGLTSLP